MGSLLSDGSNYQPYAKAGAYQSAGQASILSGGYVSLGWVKWVQASWNPSESRALWCPGSRVSNADII